MGSTKDRIVIITPVRDEELYIGNTIASMIGQTKKPVEWVIVDDGSKDRTAEIALKAAEEHPWIHVERKPDRGARAVGPGVIEAFSFGYQRLRTNEYDYLCKMDGDLEFGPRYFETLLTFFERDPRLGAASGKIFVRTGNGTLAEERQNDEMVVGAMNFYRRECFDAMGGFVQQVHWDGIAFHRVRMLGWRTRSIRHPDLVFIEQRLMGSSEKGIVTGRLRWGRGQYFMGTHPLYIFAVAFYRLFERPFVIGGLCILLGYFQAMAGGMKRYGDKAFRQSLHAWQFERLKIGTRLEKIPDPPAHLYG